TRSKRDWSSDVCSSDLVTRLSRALRPHKVAGVCGPLVGGAFLAQMLAAALKVEFFFTERALPGDGEGLYQAQYHLPRAARSRVRSEERRVGKEGRAVCA